MASTDLDQMNKLRKSLGLPLLNVPSQSGSTEAGLQFKEHSTSEESDTEPASTLEIREAEGYENFKRLQDEEKRRVQREQRKKEIQKARDAVSRVAKLEGKGLGELQDERDLDARSWLKGQKKRQSKIERDRAEKLARELEEREREAAVTYGSTDLAGVQVAHELGDFENGESEQILTLQDTQIGENESDQDDILESADVVAQDKLKDRLDLKKKRKAYDVNDDSSEKGLLSQYDEKKRKAFTLDSQGAILEERDTKRQQIGERLRDFISLDSIKPETSSDYMEIKVKKPKKSKKKSVRQRLSDDEEDILRKPDAVANSAMEIDKTESSTMFQKESVPNTFEDDDDLSRALALNRRTTLKKQKRKPEDIIKQLKEEEEEEEAAQNGIEKDGGLTLDDTTSFLDNLSSRPREEQSAQVVHKSIEVEAEAENGDVEENEDVTMGDVYNVGEDEEELLEQLRREKPTNTSGISHSGLTEEQALDQGLGATLRLLKDRGLVKAAELGDKNALYKDRQRFIVEARLREYESEQRARTQRERDRQSGKLTGMSLKEREEHARWQNTQREHQSSIQAAATFNREYKPDVQIKHVDENGRIMNMKEAFKSLSHQFHGKGSGKQKTEKHLKKIEDEKRSMAASVLDNSQAKGMNNALGTQSKKNKEAGVRLG